MEPGITAFYSALWMFGCVCLMILFRNQRVDRFRHEMFKLRDELFRDAANGLVAFDHPAYKRLRSTMNGLIRFAHRLAIWHFIITLLGSPSRGRQEAKIANEEWEDAISDLDEHQQEALNQYRTRITILVLSHFLLTPPDMFFAWFGLLATFSWFLLKGLLKGNFNHVFRTAANQTRNRFRGNGNTEELNRLAVMYTGT